MMFSYLKEEIHRSHHKLSSHQQCSHPCPRQKHRPNRVRATVQSGSIMKWLEGSQGRPLQLVFCNLYAISSPSSTLTLFPFPLKMRRMPAIDGDLYTVRLVSSLRYLLQSAEVLFVSGLESAGHHISQKHYRWNVPLWAFYRCSEYNLCRIL